MRKKTAEQNLSVIGSIREVLTGAIIALLVSIFLLLIGAILVSGEIFALENMTYYTYFAGIVAAAAGGIVAIKRNKTKALLWGIAVGISLFIMQVIIGYIFYPDISIGKHGLGHMASNLIGGMLAGFLCAGKQRRRK